MDPKADDGGRLAMTVEEKKKSGIHGSRSFPRHGAVINMVGLENLK